MNPFYLNHYCSLKPKRLVWGGLDDLGAQYEGVESESGNTEATEVDDASWIEGEEKPDETITTGTQVEAQKCMNADGESLTCEMTEGETHAPDVDDPELHDLAKPDEDEDLDIYNKSKEGGGTYDDLMAQAMARSPQPEEAQADGVDGEPEYGSGTPVDSEDDFQEGDLILHDDEEFPEEVLNDEILQKVVDHTLDLMKKDWEAVASVYPQLDQMVRDNGLTPGSKEFNKFIDSEDFRSSIKTQAEEQLAGLTQQEIAYFNEDPARFDPASNEVQARMAELAVQQAVDSQAEGVTGDEEIPEKEEGLSEEEQAENRRKIGEMVMGMGVTDLLSDPENPDPVEKEIAGAYLEFLQSDANQDVVIKLMEDFKRLDPDRLGDRIQKAVKVGYGAFTEQFSTRDLRKIGKGEFEFTADHFAAPKNRLNNLGEALKKQVEEQGEKEIDFSGGFDDAWKVLETLLAMVDVAKDYLDNGDYQSIINMGQVVVEGGKPTEDIEEATKKYNEAITSKLPVDHLIALAGGRSSEEIEKVYNTVFSKVEGDMPRFYASDLEPIATKALASALLLPNVSKVQEGLIYAGNQKINIEKNQDNQWVLSIDQKDESGGYGHKLKLTADSTVEDPTVLTSRPGAPLGPFLKGALAMSKMLNPVQEAVQPEEAAEPKTEPKKPKKKPKEPDAE